nr:unnamed protein product [Digitaria exilis]
MYSLMASPLAAPPRVRHRQALEPLVDAIAVVVASTFLLVVGDGGGLLEVAFIDGLTVVTLGVGGGAGAGREVVVVVADVVNRSVVGKGRQRRRLFARREGSGHATAASWMADGAVVERRKGSGGRCGSLCAWGVDAS